MKKNMTSQINSLAPMRSSIIELMRLKGSNMSQIHKDTGVPLTTITRLIHSTNPNPTISSLLPIAKYFGVTLNQLMGLDPLNLNNSSNGNPGAKTLRPWLHIPLISWEEAAHWLDGPPCSMAEHITSDCELSRHAFALKVAETNWEGFFMGSILIIDPEVTPEHGDYVVVLKESQTKTSLKQLLKDDDKLYLRPISKDYQTQLMDPSYQIKGVMVQTRLDR